MTTVAMMRENTHHMSNTIFKRKRKMSHFSYSQPMRKLKS
jgi:hypothetical protein